MKTILVGAGSAGIGVAQNLKMAMVAAGATEAEAYANFYVLDKGGLITSQRAGLGADVMAFARSDLPDGMQIEELVTTANPELILGLSGVKGTITPKAVELMAELQERPMVFPLSNPTTSAEITPEEVYTITQGRAIVATGSPFAPVEYGGRTLVPSQCNNMYVFPGIGLGASVCQTETIPDTMIYKSAVALSTMTSAEDVAAGKVFPALKTLRSCSMAVAEACVEHALELNLAKKKPKRGESIREFLEKKMYFPEYVPIYSEPGAP